MIRPALTIFCLALVTCGPAQAWDSAFPPEARRHLTRALDVINLTTQDLAAVKDVATPMLAVPVTRAVLHDPLRLPGLGDEILRCITSNQLREVWQALPRRLLALPTPDARRQRPVMPPMPVLGFPAPLRGFVRAASRAEALMTQAFAGLDAGEREYMAAAVLGGTFAMDINSTSRAAVVAMGVSSAVVDAVMAENMLLDPRPSASNYLALIERIDLASRSAASLDFFRAVQSLADAPGRIEWPQAPMRYTTPAGDVWIGSHGDDHYDAQALLIIDPGGDDRYAGRVAVANGLKGRPLAAIVDLGGNDRYRGDALLAPGAALFGAACILDRAGDDLYAAAYAGQAAATFGSAWLDDGAGDDVYRARGFAQGAAYAGVALLRDVAGDDLYDVGFSGQAFAGVQGLGWLWDGSGDDRYLAGGRKHDFDRHDTRYLTTAQGFSIGMRPFAGGGIAALMDLGGNDSYVADVYGQGCGYWYAIGMLLDLGGHDTYNVYHYGQGSGIHLSAGLLVDGGGDDHYTGYSLTQGNGHDYAVGMLIDHGGRDQYAAHEHSQGRGFFNSFGLLADLAGHDSYLARRPDQCQGLGHDGHYREYPSLGVLLDLAGRDVYAVDLEDGATLKRADVGVIYDLEEEP